MSRRQTIVDQRLEFELLGDDCCCWAELPLSRIEPEPLPLVAETLTPGDRLTYIGGKKTSAGFTVVDMIKPNFIEYLGAVTNLDGKLAVFRPSNVKTPGWFAVYWIIDQTLMHFTPACSGRLVETSTIVHFPVDQARGS